MLSGCLCGCLWEAQLNRMNMQHIAKSSMLVNIWKTVQ